MKSPEFTHKIVANITHVLLVDMPSHLSAYQLCKSSSTSVKVLLQIGIVTWNKEGFPQLKELKTKDTVKLLTFNDNPVEINSKDRVLMDHLASPNP